MDVLFTTPGWQGDTVPAGIHLTMHLGMKSEHICQLCRKFLNATNSTEPSP
jgi:hypothetical protein